MATAATLPAIAKALDRVFVRLDSVEARQLELAHSIRKLSVRVGRIERGVAVLSKTIDRFIDYAADTKLAVEEVTQQVGRLRERSEKTFDHFDVVVDMVDKQRHELASLHERHDRTEKRVAALASK